MANTKTATSVDNDAVVRRLYAQGQVEAGQCGAFWRRRNWHSGYVPPAGYGWYTPLFRVHPLLGAARSFLAQQRKPWGKYLKGR